MSQQDENDRKQDGDAMRQSAGPGELAARQGHQALAGSGTGSGDASPTTAIFFPI